MQLEFYIPGKPIAKKRPKFWIRKKKDGGIASGGQNIQKTEEGKFLTQILEQLPQGFKKFDRDTGLIIYCLFCLPIPKGSKKKMAAMAAGEIPHIKRPDSDNLIKFVKDCFNGIIWHDDAQVVREVASKTYSFNPGTRIILKEF